MHLAGVTLEWFQKGPLLSLRFQWRGADLFVFIVAFIREFILVEAFLWAFSQIELPTIYPVLLA